jgi:hypothetical protein
MPEKYKEYDEYCQMAFKVHPKYNIIAFDKNGCTWMYELDCVIAEDPAVGDISYWRTIGQPNNNYPIEIALPSCPLPYWKDSKRYKDGVQSMSEVKLEVHNKDGLYYIYMHSDVSTSLIIISNAYTLAGFNGISVKGSDKRFVTFLNAIDELGFGVVPEYVWIKK